METDTFIALGAFFTSACALFLAVSESKENRKHNKLSVKPSLSFSWNTIDEIVDVTIKNNGLGSAVIKSFNVSLDNENTMHTKWADALDTVDYYYEQATSFSLYTNESLAPSETMLLFKVEFSDRDSCIQADVISKLVVKIIYASMYGELSTIILKNDDVNT